MIDLACSIAKDRMLQLTSKELLKRLIYYSSFIENIFCIIASSFYLFALKLRDFPHNTMQKLDIEVSMRMQKDILSKQETDKSKFPSIKND